MKETALTATHIALGAKMSNFAGYNMPIVYSSIQEEHMSVRNGVGIFDVSHMGEFRVSGTKALDYLQRVTSNDVSRLKIGQAQYSCIPNRTGGIIDDLIIYRLGEEDYFLVVNAANITKDWDWLNKENLEGVSINDESEKIGLVAIQGPKAVETLQKLTKVNLDSIKFYHFERDEIGGINDAIISATGYTGSGGFEIYVPDGELNTLWDKVMVAGAEFNIKPCGLGARDTLRLEKGYCLYGNDLTDETSPIEAGLSWITKTNKNSDFNSKSIFQEQKANGIKRKLVGFKVEDRRVPRNAYKILNDQEEEIGFVTSGTQSPMLGIPIGLGYIAIEYANEGQKILIHTGRKNLSASICKLPFV